MVKMYDIIRFLCDHNDISVAQMCKDIGLRQGLISDLKHGRSKSLSAANMQKIANYFQVSTDIFSEGAFEELLPNNADMQLLKEIYLRFSLQKDREPAGILTSAQLIDKKLAEMGMSRKQLAIAAKISPEALDSILYQDDSINLRMLYTICDVLSIDPFSLMDFEQATHRIECYLNNTISGRLLSAFDKLNDLGKEIAIERLEELVEIPKYKETYVEETDTTD